jgi:hypothetical protein
MAEVVGGEKATCAEMYFEWHLAPRPGAVQCLATRHYIHGGASTRLSIEHARTRNSNKLKRKRACLGDYSHCATQ